jgi:hypothetical protein
VVDIFDEVEEDLRAERAGALLRRYGGLILGAALLVVLAAGGWQGWRWYQNRESGKIAEIYFAAMTQADALPPTGGDAAKRNAAANAFLAVAAQGNEGFRTLARLRAAALKAGAGDDKTALALWDQVASDSRADPLLRDLASLLSVQHQIDTGDPALLTARLQPLAEPDNPWHAMAEEEQALLDLRTGKPDAARATLKSLAADNTAPEGVRSRASGLLAEIGG